MIKNNRKITLKNGKEIIALLINGWSVFCASPIPTWDKTTVGKWLIAGIDVDKAMELCCKAVAAEATQEAKHSMTAPPQSKSICCFYVNGSDAQAHKRLLDFLRRENALPKKKDGTYCNISFKYDQQTLNGEYGKDFTPRHRLSDFLDLATGEWIYSEEECYQ